MEGPLDAAALGQLVARIRDNTISGKIAKDVFAAMWAGETAGMGDAKMGASLRSTDRIFEPQWSDDQRESFFDNWRKATASSP
mgnify:CR=1 FL=1